MGKKRFPNDGNSELDTGALRVITCADGQNGSAAAVRPASAKTNAKSSEEGHGSDTARYTLFDYAANTSARQHTFRVVYNRLEALRTASLSMLDAVKDCEKSGVSFEEIVRSIRLDHEDWQDDLSDVMRVGMLLDAVGARTRIDAVLLTDTPIDGSKDKIKTAYSDGYLAGVVGRQVEYNPYVYRSEEYQVWLNGHKKGRLVETP